MTNYEKYKSALDSILPTVEKPARYTGGEWNAIRKSTGDINTRIALCFPDTYEIGMSHLGLKIPVRRGDNPNVRPQSFVTANPFEFLFLEHAQQRDLHFGL